MNTTIATDRQAAAQRLNPRALVLIIALQLLAVVAFAQGSILVPDAVYIKENARNRKATPYVNEREADMMWSKRVWRTIDLREKMNHPLYYPENELNGRKSLFDVMKNALLTGELHAYANPVFDDEFKVTMQLGEIKQMFHWVDSTNYQPDPNDPNQQILIPIDYYLTSKDIKQYWIKEDWFFDKQRGVMDVRILGICPIKEKIDPSTGAIIGYQPLFWIYFPEFRPVLARSEAFNTKNDAERRTYDDLFWKRQFGSYVHKETNVYDRPINAYATGVDALLEADRVKEETFITEHDLFHF
ncbi:MAG: gliding motility protein GldN [Bacteroidia bacterium]